MEVLQARPRRPKINLAAMTLWGTSRLSILNDPRPAMLVAPTPRNAKDQSQQFNSRAVLLVTLKLTRRVRSNLATFTSSMSTLLMWSTSTP